MDTLTTVAFVEFDVLVLGSLALYGGLILKRLLKEEQKESWVSGVAAKPQYKLQSEPLFSLDELGKAPIFGDSSDLGAVDIALKIKDLQASEKQTASWAERSDFERRLKEEVEKLVEVTLLQVAPPELEAEDYYMDPEPGAENVIWFNPQRPSNEPEC